MPPPHSWPMREITFRAAVKAGKSRSGTCKFHQIADATWRTRDGRHASADHAAVKPRRVMPRRVMPRRSRRIQ
jgi:hypothetical protein